MVAKFFAWLLKSRLFVTIMPEEQRTDPLKRPEPVPSRAEEELSDTQAAEIVTTWTLLNPP